MSFSIGQQVLIKNPRNLAGRIIGERPGDKFSVIEERHLLVRIEEREMYFLPSDLQAAEEPIKKLSRYSPEWAAEMQRLLEAGERLMADKTDQAALLEFSEAGNKLGLYMLIAPTSK